MGIDWLRRFPIDVRLPGNVEASPARMDQIRRTGARVAINNLPVPSEAQRAGSGSGPVAQDIFRLTGLDSTVHAPAGTPAAELARGVFVQASGSTYGIHVDTRSKGRSLYSSINPLYQLPSPRTPDRDWFFPWRDSHPFVTQLSVRWNAEVRQIEARTPESHAYGHPSLEFIDVKSGRHLYFTVLAYSTIDVTCDHSVQPDVGSGIVIVGTLPLAEGPYGRSTGNGWARIPRSYAAGGGPGRRSQGDFRLDVAEFRRVLAAARRLDARLSSDPGEFILDNYHFNNEVVDEGEIGLSLQVELGLLRR